MKVLSTVILVICFLQTKAQLTVEELKTLELGQKFEAVQPILAEKFEENIAIFQGDKHDTYRMASPLTDSLWILKKDRPAFDVYGDSRITFQFANEVLIAVEIRFEFMATPADKEKFERTLTSLVSGFTNDRDFFVLENPAGQEFNIDAIVQQVKTNCDSKNENEAYRNQSAFMATAAWEVHKRVNNIPRHKLLTLQAYKTAITSMAYTGCVSVIELIVSNEAFFGLYNTINAARVQYEEIDLEE